MPDDIRHFLAEERTKARAKLLAQGTPPELVEQLLSVAEVMHAEQAACADRMVGNAPSVVVH